MKDACIIYIIHFFVSIFPKIYWDWPVNWFWNDWFPNSTMAYYVRVELLNNNPMKWYYEIMWNDLLGYLGDPFLKALFCIQKRAKELTTKVHELRCRRKDMSSGPLGMTWAHVPEGSIMSSPTYVKVIHLNSLSGFYL